MNQKDKLLNEKFNIQMEQIKNERLIFFLIGKYIFMWILIIGSFIFSQFYLLNVGFIKFLFNIILIIILFGIFIHVLNIFKLKKINIELQKIQNDEEFEDLNNCK